MHRVQSRTGGPGHRDPCGPRRRRRGAHRGRPRRRAAGRAHRRDQHRGAGPGRGRRVRRAPYRHRDRVRRAVRHGGRRLPDRGAERPRRAVPRLVGARDRRDALRLRRRRPGAAVAAAPGAPALLGQGRRRDPGHRADRRRLAAAARSGGSASWSSRCCCWSSRSGNDVWWQWRHRRDHVEAEQAALAVPSGGSRRAVTVAAVAVLWIALAPPRVADGLGPGDLLRIPVEGLVLVGVALALPPRPRRIAAVGLGSSPPPSPCCVRSVSASTSTWTGRSTCWATGPTSPRDSRWCATPTAGHRRRCCSPVLVVLTARAGRAAALGRAAGDPVGRRAPARFGPDDRRARVGVGAVRGVRRPSRAGGRGRLRRAGRRHGRPGARGLRRPRDLPGRDRGGRVRRHPARAAARGAARQGRPGRVGRELRPGRARGHLVRPAIVDVLEQGDRQLTSAGYQTRSAFLTSPTFGAGSWLAHATLQSGLWVDSEQRYGQLLDSDRMSLTDAFGRAGWRTAFTCRRTPGTGPRARRTTGSTRCTTRATSATQGPEFGYASMPDQYTLDHFRRTELAPTDRRPVMAEIDLVSSHHPWAPLPRVGAVERGRRRLGVRRHARAWRGGGRRRRGPGHGQPAVRRVDRVHVAHARLVAGELPRPRPGADRGR